MSGSDRTVESGRPRDSYALAGAAMRQAIQRANTTQLTNAQHKVFGAVIALTASYSRLSDNVFVDDIRRVAKVSDKTARTALSRLAAEGIIVWKPQRGHGMASTLSLPAAVGESGSNEQPDSSTRIESGLANETGKNADDQPEEIDQETGSPGLPIPEDREEPRRRAKAITPPARGKSEQPDDERSGSWTAAYRSLAEVTMSHPKQDAGRLVTALKSIFARWRDEGGDEADLAAEIHRRANMYRSGWPELVLTPNALANHWGRVKMLKPRQKGLTSEEFSKLDFSHLDPTPHPTPKLPSTEADRTEIPPPSASPRKEEHRIQQLEHASPATRKGRQQVLAESGALRFLAQLSRTGSGRIATPN